MELDYQKPKFVDDLKQVDEFSDSAWFPANVKTLNRLKDLNITKIWIDSANEKDLEKIRKLINPIFLDIYQIQASNLNILEEYTEAKTINLNWNTKATSLWRIEKNANLRSLTISDFSKLRKLDGIQSAKQLTHLTLSGGINTALKIETLLPLQFLEQLKYLKLSNIKVSNESLRPLSKLTQLELLELSNQFKVEEFAWLSTRLVNTECERFSPISSCSIKDVDGKIIWDVMVTGKRKPFLNSETQLDKVKEYINKYAKLCREFRNNSFT